MEALTAPKNGTGIASVNDLIWDLEKKKELAQIFIKSGLIPSQLNTPEKVLVCMFKSQELGLPPLEGLSGMAVINGKVTLQGNLLLALINRSGKVKEIKLTETNDSCTCYMSRRDYNFEYTFSFSMEDARKANLLDKAIWKQYGKTMLKWRAVSGCARVVFSDVIGGMYMPEEIASTAENVSATVDENENVIVQEIEKKPQEKQPENKKLEPTPDPNKGVQEKIDATKNEAELKAVWDALSPEQKKIFKNAVNFQKEQLKKVPQDVQFTEVKDTLMEKIKSITSKTDKKTLSEIDGEIDKAKEGKEKYFQAFMQKLDDIKSDYEIQSLPF